MRWAERGLVRAVEMWGRRRGGRGEEDEMEREMFVRRFVRDSEVEKKKTGSGSSDGGSMGVVGVGPGGGGVWKWVWERMGRGKS